VAGEVRSPGRTLPLAMLGGTVVVSLLYALLCGAFVRVLGFDGLAAAGEAGSALAGAVLGPEAVAGVAGLVVLALLASVNGTILGGARVAQALAARGLLPAPLARVSPATGVPVTALWVQAAIACLLVLSGTFQAILALSGLAMMLVGSLSVVALYRLRRRQPERPRPYRATGYPLSPLLYLGASLGTLMVSAAGALEPGADRLPLVGIGVWLLLAGGHRLATHRR
ncbi:MAG: APC family permease, partial [Deltaproteobacteria bacterium]